jgi:exopolysaccharide biosynthesis WecB/TagA/CpsF family protein
MIATDAYLPAGAASRGTAGLYRGLMLMSSALLLLLDLACLLMAVPLSSALYELQLAPSAMPFLTESRLGTATLLTLSLAPLILYDARFGVVARRGGMSPLLGIHFLRLTLLTGLIIALSMAGGAMESRGALTWLLLWFCTALLLTLVVRFLGGRMLQALQSRGHLSETVAIVGSGPAAERVASTLRRTPPGTVELVGIFDDGAAGTGHDCARPCGNIEQLLELGKTARLDWILLALPEIAEHRIDPLLKRLKALSTPIGLCPAPSGPDLACGGIDYLGDGVPVSVLADRAMTRWDALARAAEEILPRWIVTLALLPVNLINALAAHPASRQRVGVRRPAAPLTTEFDAYDLESFSRVAAEFGQDGYGYVVTPNADHLIRLHESTAFRNLYESASYVLLDSRFIAKILRMTRGVDLPVCTGSDLTAKLLTDEVRTDDRVVLIGGKPAQARQLRERFGLQQLAHFNPPMGFIRDPAAVEACLVFIESHSPFRYCMLAVGSPQQEILAQQLQRRGRARGLALCIGASIDFLTGVERRAPVWLQRCAMEWFYRLLQAPARMGKRYLLRGPRVFRLLRRTQVILRPATRHERSPVPAHEEAVLAASS